MAISIEELSADTSFTQNVKGQVSFLPEPERAPRLTTVISVDDHIVEPPDAFADRFPAKYAEQAPRIVEQEDGSEAWLYAGHVLPNVGFNAVVGRPVSEYSFDPTRFADMRRGAWDIHARIADMDLNGVYASMCFPSFLPGFCGQRFQQLTDDPELALAAVRAWNDWNIEEWSGAYPDRMIPCQVTYFLDPEVGAAEVYRNAERGYRAISFSEAPHALGFPSLHSGHWDPIMAACEETGTVVCLHVGSSGTSPSTSPDAPADTVGVLFFGYAMFAAVDWLYSKIPVRFPNIRIALSEGGTGWVAGLLDRLEHVRKYDSMYGTWNDVALSPADTLRRNFWFCAIDDPSAYDHRHYIGVENLMVESDYPHADSSWPDTQALLARQLAGVPAEEVERICWGNASELFRHPVPDSVVADPESF